MCDGSQAGGSLCNGGQGRGGCKLHGIRLTLFHGHMEVGGVGLIKFLTSPSLCKSHPLLGTYAYISTGRKGVLNMSKLLIMSIVVYCS